MRIERFIAGLSYYRPSLWAAGMEGKDLNSMKRRRMRLERPARPRRALLGARWDCLTMKRKRRMTTILNW